MKYLNDKHKQLLSPLVKQFMDFHSDYQMLDLVDFICLPGFCDPHVHFREPGFEYKGTIKTESMAAAKGGYTTVFTMPNLNPVPDCLENLQVEMDAIQKNSVIEALPYGSITKGEKGEELSDMDSLKTKVVAFSDDGKGVQSEAMMQSAMEKAKLLGKTIVAHCEVNDLLNGGYIHDGEYAKEHGHKGISSESEWKQVERDIKLAELTGCPYHICHISTKESVELVRQAKKKGINVTCEVTPHHLLLDEIDLQENGRFKMNPPLRSPEDHKALILGLMDGTIDMIATDHAPHSDEEKDNGLQTAPFGIVGLETAFPLLCTELVLNGVISLERLVELVSDSPRKRFNIPFNNSFTIWRVISEEIIDENNFLSMSHRSPFNGYGVKIENMLTVYQNKIIYEKEYVVREDEE